MGIDSTNEPQNCWEFMKCKQETRENCDVYRLDAGKECWFLTNVHKGCNNLKDGDCFNCPWFKKNNPDL